MEVNEVFSSSKTGKENNNEDGFVISDDFVAIFDGVTSKGNHYDWGLSNGIFCKNLLVDVMKNVSNDISYKDLFLKMNQTIKGCYGDNFNYFVDNFNDRLQATAIIYSNYYKQIWIYGDSKCLVNSIEIVNYKEIDQINENIRSAVLKTYYDINQLPYNSVLNEDVGRNAILPLLTNQGKLANKDKKLGYPVVDGITFNLNQVKVINVKNNDTIILSSDGYPKLFSTLKKSEEYLFEVLREDPMMFYLYKSTKGLDKNHVSFDDRTYIKFKA